MNLPLPGPRARLRAFARRLGAATSGAALVEIAAVMPVFTAMGMYGTEIAYMSTVNMQVSELSLALADNAARLGQTDNSGVTPTINETDIDSIMLGANTQGRDINFTATGRVILSSLEYDGDSARQYIHWQRCAGTLARSSAYGGTNYGLTGTAITGLGKLDGRSRPAWARRSCSSRSSMSISRCSAGCSSIMSKCAKRRHSLSGTTAT